MLELTQERVSDWAASFGWPTSPVELEPDAAEQWALRIEGHEGLYATDVVWFAAPASMLTVRTNLQVHDDHRSQLAKLNVADRLAWLTDMRLSMVRYHPAVDFMAVPSDDETEPPMPQSVMIVAHVVVDESVSRTDFLNAFLQVQRAVTDVDVSIQRLALGRMFS